jgi:hypothetical protein
MWRTVGAVPFNSQVVFKAHADYTPPRQPPRRQKKRKALEIRRKQRQRHKQPGQSAGLLAMISSN